MITIWFVGNKLKTFGERAQQSFARFYGRELLNTTHKGISLMADTLSFEDNEKLIDELNPNQKNMARKSALNPVVVIGVLFFIFGFITWMNGTLIPFLKLACNLKTDAEAFFVTFAFYMAYFFLAIPSSAILKITGMKMGMSWGLIVMALGALLFIPAANSRSFALFLTGLFVQGMGLALLQTASNPYISIIGPIESAAKRISIMGICNKGAGILSPIILSTIVLKNANQLQEKINGAADALTKDKLLNELAGRIIYPYLVMAVVLFILAIMIRSSPLPDI